MLNIKTVTIVGANGTMGASVAGIFASFGMAKVYLVSRSIEKSQKAVEKAVSSVRANSIRKRLIPKTYEDLEKCVEESDWVFESIAENIQLKKEINDRIAKVRKEGTIVSTGTSGLSVSKLKESYDEDGQKMYFGTHFFNPPYNLPLCELMATESSDESLKEELKKYLEIQLKRKVVVVKDAPAFLANRIGFQFLNEVAQLAENYKEEGGIDYIDSILGGFSGRGMKPLVTVDFVGLDIHKAIVDNLYDNTNDFCKDSFVMPEFVELLIAEGKLGRKSGQGFFKLEIDELGNKTKLVYDISSKRYRKAKRYQFDFATDMVKALREGEYETAMKVLKEDKSEPAQLCQYLTYKYVLYSLAVALEVAESYHDADIAMGYGFSWMPPLAWLEFVGGSGTFIADIQENKFFEDVKMTVDDMKVILDKAETSRIDGRRFFKAKY